MLIKHLAGMYYVYILTNKNKTALYTGVTNNLELRVTEHYRQQWDLSSFTGKYKCFNLIYFEEYRFINEAIQREKVIKNRSRKWKEMLIATENPEWMFLNEGVFEQWPPDDRFHR
jgi:putative endonuclease